MHKFFNTAGPIKKELHYYIPPLERIDWDEVQMLIASQKYFIIHAPRQTGKTSVLLEIMATLNKQDQYNALYINIEPTQVARNNIETGIQTVCNILAQSAKLYLKDQRLTTWLHSLDGKTSATVRFNAMLAYWAEINDKPIVLLIDEVDSLIGDTLVSLLRQIRSGYTQRPTHFPQSIILCGLRDVKDYRIHVSTDDIITGGSAFNIKSKSMRLNNFTSKEIQLLFQQHSKTTGQLFDEEIITELWQDTQGQPWLINALGYEMTWENKDARDRDQPITLEQYYIARDNLIQSRATHLDQLVDKLNEPRVHEVIASLLSGEQSDLKTSHDDLQYIEDLGLIIQKPQIRISNRIYREIIPRELTAVTQANITQEQSWYLTSENHLDMNKLLTAFQQFYRENSESWIERFDYKEAGSQLLMQAFLQRIINGGGRIFREYALGRKRTDLCIEWPVDHKKGFYGDVQKI
ncbi:MAG: AAA family ATPase, partial [Methylococcales bacterium]|nr:AAA family ATPase [Methylococcales bacterium]